MILFGCQKQTSKAVDIITGLEGIDKITIITFKNEKRVIEEIKDSEAIVDFINMFSPSNSQPADKSKISTPDKFDGQIVISYQDDKMISVNISLDNCYEFSFKNNLYREKFTYRLGMYLSEIFSKKG